jgi:hypothetical protein
MILCLFPPHVEKDTNLSLPRIEIYVNTKQKRVVVIFLKNRFVFLSNSAKNRLFIRRLLVQ